MAAKGRTAAGRLRKGYRLTKRGVVKVSSSRRRRRSSSRKGAHHHRRRSGGFLGLK